MDLREIGLDSWLQEQADNVCPAEQRIARVTAVDRGRYLVSNGRIETPAEVTGKLLYGADSVLDLPCVGDWVCVQVPRLGLPRGDPRHCAAKIVPAAEDSGQQGRLSGHRGEY